MKLKLTETKERDIEFVLQAENDESNSPFIAHWDYNLHRDSLMENDIRHMIVRHTEDDRPVGYMIMAGFAGPHKSAELKRLVITEKGKGYGRQVLGLVKEMVFKQMDFHRLWLDVREHNERAIALYGKCGFVKEGLIRECVLTDKGFESIYIMGILKNEYKPD